MATKSSSRKPKKSRKKAAPRKKAARGKKSLRKKPAPAKKSMAARAGVAASRTFDAMRINHDVENTEHQHEPFDEDFPPDLGGSE